MGQWCFQEGDEVQGGADARGQAAPRAEERPLRCRRCGQLITERRAAVEVAGAHRHSFFNPAGVLFEIGCFAQAPGCLLSGRPTTEFSWFPGYAWRYAVCAACALHLGWAFSDPAGAGFLGLILERLREEAGG